MSDHRYAEELVEHPHLWEWPVVWGYFSEKVRSYLLGKTTRDELTSVFALLEMACDLRFNALPARQLTDGTPRVPDREGTGC